jgi:hypothetical protein
MSMPTLTYGCTACDLRAWDSKTWGHRFYKIDGNEFRMHVAMGWCEGCSDLSVIEIKPTGVLESELAAKVARLHAELAVQLLRTPPFRSWWQLMATKSSEVICVEFAVSHAEESLASLRQLLPLMQARKSASRCLECQSEQCFLLPVMPIKDSYDDVYSSAMPVPLDCDHPGCGGTFTVNNEGLRFSVRTVTRAYDLEGRLLSEASD